MMMRCIIDEAMRKIAALLAVAGLSLAARAQTPLLEAPARLGAAHPVDEAVKPAAFALPEENARIVPDQIAEGAAKPIAPPSYQAHPVDDFLRSKPILASERKQTRHDAGKFGDGLADLLDPQKPKEWLFSDHGFDCITTPISNPFLAEDPRALTEIRPIFIYQNVPGSQPNFQGGNIWFFGARGSIALTDRFSITLNKLGGIDVRPGSATMPSDFGFAELWLGPKYTFWRDTQTGTVAAGGLIFQIPTGSSKTLQDTGSLSLTPYVSVGQTLQEFNSGAFNGIATAGYTFATDHGRSDYFYMTGHLDFDVGNYHRFYPVVELNWFQYGKGGDRYFSGQGQDLINTGAQNSASAGIITGAIGARFKITEASQFGAAFELPIFGNRDLFQYRFTIDFIFRY
jgi:hypothetical protein